MGKRISTWVTVSCSCLLLHPGLLLLNLPLPQKVQEGSDNANPYHGYYIKKKKKKKKNDPQRPERKVAREERTYVQRGNMVAGSAGGCGSGAPKKR